MFRKCQVKPAVTALLLVVFFVIIVAFAGKLYAYFTSCEVKAQACRNAVNLADLGVGSLDACETCREEIKPPSKEVDKRTTFTEKFIADSLHRCWYEFGEGEKYPFKHAEGEEETEETKAHCFICSEFKLPEDVESITQGDLTEYLKGNRYKEEEQTYYQYLEEGVYEKDNEVYLFVEEMALEKKGSVYTKYIKEPPYKAPFTLIKDLIKSIFGSTASETKMESLKSDGTKHAIVFYQVSTFLNDNKLKAEFLEVAGETALGKNLYDELLLLASPPRPSYIFVTKLENVENMGCEVLQG